MDAATQATRREARARRVAILWPARCAAASAEAGAHAPREISPSDRAMSRHRFELRFCSVCERETKHHVPSGKCRSCLTRLRNDKAGNPLANQTPKQRRKAGREGGLAVHTKRRALGLEVRGRPRGPKLTREQRLERMPRGENHWNWQGGAYVTVHNRLSFERGRAAERPCADCGETADQWSYRGGAPDEAIDERRGFAWSADLDFYVPRCRSCHAKYDAKRRRTTHEPDQART
jgi:hypothetical protein